MSARGFGPVLWAGAIAGAALGFYLVSLNVASERAELEQVETRIALAQRDIRLLQTEIGTRGRLAQLERWNVRFIRLSAPSADQFVEGGFHLASLVAPQKKPAFDAPVVLASAQIGQQVPQQPRLTGDSDSAGTARSTDKSANELMHVASYGTVPQPAPGTPAPAKDAAGDKPTAGGTALEGPRQRVPATKPAKSAMADPLAPLPGARSKSKGGTPTASAGGAISQNRTLKDRVTD